MGEGSGTGVAFTRNPITGEDELFGDYLANAQGEDVVAGIREPSRRSPRWRADARRLQAVPADRQEAGVPLQGRPGPRVHDRAGQALHAPDPDGEADRRGGREDRGRHGQGGHDLEGGGGRPGRAGPARAAAPAPFDPNALKGATTIVNGLTASPGAAVGRRSSTPTPPRSGWTWRGGDPRPGRDQPRRRPRHGRGQGILTARGGATSHAAVVARQMGRPCVAGSAELLVDYAASRPTAT